ncbi:MAG: hypothetical protein AAF468_04890 [Pseudomonadota bacterium]
MLHSPKVELDSKFRLSLAETDEERDRLFEFRYKIFHQTGALNTVQNGRFVDQYDALPSSFLLYVTNERNEITGSVRLTVHPPADAVTDFPPTSPELAVFPDVIARFVESGVPLAGLSRLCIDPNAGQMVAILSAVAFGATRLGFLSGCRWLFATVIKEHQDFYRRFAAIESVGTERTMPFLTSPYFLGIGNLDQMVKSCVSRMPKRIVATIEHDTNSLIEDMKDRLDLVREAKIWPQV